MVGKIYEGNLIDRIRRVTGGLIDDYYLLRSITRLAVHPVPYRRGSLGPAIGHTGGRT